MLIKQVVLDRIAKGEIDTLFRRQKRPTVKSGGTLRTSIGMLDIISVEQIDPDRVTSDDARRAGFDSIDSVVASLNEKPEGVFLRVRVRLGGPDPLIVLRQRSALDDSELGALTKRLDGLDRASGRGPWTRRLMRIVADHPHVRAPDLAASIGWETPPFKDNMRKLKALGLTISHSPGYELSPRGHTALAALGDGLDAAEAGS